MGAGGAVQVAEVVVGVEVLRDGGVALLARRLLGVQGHFGTLDHDVVDLKLFPPAAKKDRIGRLASRYTLLIGLSERTVCTYKVPS